MSSIINVFDCPFPLTVADFFTRELLLVSDASRRALEHRSRCECMLRKSCSAAADRDRSSAEVSSLPSPGPEQDSTCGVSPALLWPLLRLLTILTMMDFLFLAGRKSISHRSFVLLCPWKLLFLIF